MAYDYTLSLDKVSYYPQLNGCDKVVKDVHWHVNMFDTSDPDVSISIGIVTELDTSGVSADTFSDWASVTQTMILQWCADKNGGESYIQSILDSDSTQEQLRIKRFRTELVEANVSEIPEE